MAHGQPVGSGAGAGARGVELVEELGAASLLVGLTNGAGCPAEAVDRPKEPLVLRVSPAHVPRPAPSGRPESVQATVVADPVVGVGLHVVAPGITEVGPGVEEARERRDHLCQGDRASAWSRRWRASAGGAGSTVSFNPPDIEIATSSATGPG